MIRALLLGCGPWGKNLVRVLMALPGVRLVAVADPVPERLEGVRPLVGTAALVRSFEQACAFSLDAVVIATPPATHATLALAALDAGLDVFVEKPLAVVPADAERCAARAAALGRVAMVGHLLRYHPTIEKLVALAHSGALGRLVHFGARRFSIAGDRATPTLWTLGPHDLSVLHALRVASLEGLDAVARSSGERLVLDTMGGAPPAGRIELSRAHPHKVRSMRLVGSEATASFDDVASPDRIKLATRGGERVVCAAWTEPLAAEMAHFVDCVATRRPPLTPFEEGASVVRLLAHAAAQLDAPLHALPD